MGPVSQLLIKKKIQKLDYSESIKWALSQLHLVDNKGLKNMASWAPWYLILFMKYAAKYSNGISLEIHKNYAYYDSKIKCREDAYMSKTNQEVMKFFLRLAHQQFIFQEVLTNLKNKLVRQYPLYSEYKDEIHQYIGITLEDYLQLSFLVFSQISAGNRSINRVAFNSISIDAQTVERYLELISLTPTSLKSIYMEKDVFDEKEIYNLEPFITKPFLKLDEDYVVTSLGLLTYSMSYGIYDAIKQSKPLLRKHFGPSFEGYISENIQNTCNKFALEDDIQKNIKEEGVGPIDAIIETDLFQIFLEFKATELPIDTRLNPSVNEFENKKQNLIKAIKQHIVFNKYFKETHNCLPTFDKNKQGIFLIISYKPTYLGRATNYWEDICQYLKNNFSLDQETVNEINPDNILFLSVDDFDWLLSKYSLIDDILKSTLKKLYNNEIHEFSQILPKYLNKNDNIPWLNSMFDKFISESVKKVIT